MSRVYSSFLYFLSSIRIVNTLSKTFTTLPRRLVHHILAQNNIFMVTCTCVRGSTLASLAMVLVLEAGGKPSTWFPPEGLVQLTSHARGMRMSSNHFLITKIEISKDHKNVIILRFYQNFEVTFNISLAD